MFGERFVRQGMIKMRKDRQKRKKERKKNAAFLRVLSFLFFSFLFFSSTSFPTQKNEKLPEKTFLSSPSLRP